MKHNFIWLSAKLKLKGIATYVENETETRVFLEFWRWRVQAFE